MVASEAVPYAKTGGLGDVVGVLPAVLASLGHDVRLVLPLYASIDPARYGLQVVARNMGVPMGNGTHWCRVLGHRTTEGFDTHFIEYDEFFRRGGIYGERGWGYVDNAERFLLLSRAALQLCQDTGFAPDVVHCHDWMTAAVPAYLKYFMGNDPVLGRTGSLLTIHNIGHAYQGRAPQSAFAFSGLPWHAFDSKQFEDVGWTNMLKGGIYWSDVINAVSPTFAHEITTPEGGADLDPYLRRRRGDLHGILNGVDYRAWSPETDRHIAALYRADDMWGKVTCKEALQRSYGLDVRWDLPLLGVVSRMSSQKGLDLILPGLPELVANGAQFVLVGSGDKPLENAFRALANRYPSRVGAFLGFDDARAHQLEAGADFFLMPSRWEPCGLNQLYSLRYGTLPVVRATGGLDDTVENYDAATGDGTGFKFTEPSAKALRNTALWAMGVFYKRKDHIQAMRYRGMQQRFEWTDAAHRYLQLYHWAQEKRRHWR